MSMWQKIVLAIFGILLMLTGCSTEKVMVKEDVDISQYEVVYTNIDYIIYIRSEIPEQAYYMYAKTILSDEGNPCLMGHYEDLNYVLEYENEYYYIVDGEKLGLYTANKLVDLGIIECTAK